MKKLIGCLILLVIFSCGNPGSSNDPVNPNPPINPDPDPDNPVEPDYQIKVEQVDSSIKVSWIRYGSDEGYTVYKKDPADDWTPISMMLNDTSYLYSDVEHNKSFYYGIREKNQQSIISTPQTFAVSSVSTPGSPSVANLKANYLQSDSGVFLTWNELATGTTYHIYRSEVQNEIGKVIGITANLSYYDEKTLANNILEGRVYYYRILWSNPTTPLTQGDSITYKEGFFFNKTDTREPENNDKDNVTENSFTLDVNSEGSIDSLLYKLNGMNDIDWYKHTVPAHSTHFLDGRFTNLKSLGLMEVFKENVSIGEYLFPETNTPLDISLSNNTASEMVFYIKVSPNNRVSLEDFIHEYSLSITSF